MGTSSSVSLQGNRFLFQAGKDLNVFLQVVLPPSHRRGRLAALQVLNASNPLILFKRLRSPCDIGETELGVETLVGADDVKALRVEEQEKEDNMTAEKVMEEEKGYIKTTRLCQFFNIC